ncbi:hypothetical protein [Acetobacter sp.]|jgi:hypothetical protein|uniref:hypothetical protein n=1 Tax=Acetobacter sp. TaxID=440 RepID=UPI0025C0A832|nr:hypothetical protein [Acetobacter sp.]MCH4090324.1 hypothetical protein [Acetobacter sp.]MCI1299018.1 hypothetical protein [Acetobacter sp.]MCI1315038.1 hypothetical protein [Acetobacter sp.]
MDVSIIFETVFQGSSVGSVWIVESPENRRWFERQTGLDGESALFTFRNSENVSDMVLGAIWNVQEHYPEWSQITVIGMSLTPDLVKALRDETRVTATSKGFSLSRSR